MAPYFHLIVCMCVCDIIHDAILDNIIILQYVFNLYGRMSFKIKKLWWMDYGDGMRQIENVNVGHFIDWRV